MRSLEQRFCETGRGDGKGRKKIVGKLIITSLPFRERTYLFTGLHDGKRFYEIQFDQEEAQEAGKTVLHASAADSVGNIYVARVRDVVKNIDAAFLEYQKGKKGYFSMAENTTPVFLNRKNTTKVCEGDLLMVQLKKAPVRTKEPVFTSHISLSGKTIVLNVGKSGIGFSGKLKDRQKRDCLTEELAPILAEMEAASGMTYGVVVRTNAAEVPETSVIEELQRLFAQFGQMAEKAAYSSPFTVLYREEEAYLKRITGAYEGELEEIVTDSRDIYDCIGSYIKQHGLVQYQGKVRFYEDELQPLYKLYSIEKVCEQALGEKVWMKSGAYLIMQQTEAMYVIDVNTGKCIRGKDLRKTVLQVNMEAAREIAYQLRLRNISGIIMIDFISMTEEEDKKALIEVIRQSIAKDRVKTDFVEMTKLDLVELTRKKIHSPVHEQLKV